MGLLNFFGKSRMLFAVVFAISLAAFFISAEPTGPSDTQVLASGRYGTFNGANISAMAGNVSEINFNITFVTNTWQGYYGNITGAIVLGNANNQSMYNWNLSSPTGEIYATRVSTVPSWSTISCASTAEVEAEDTALGVNDAIDRDSANRTFLNTTTFNSFYVGNVNIATTQDCKAVNLNDQTGAPSSNFAEVILHDGANTVYTALITQDSNGFDSRTHDFEMIVGEDGHNGNTAATPYYFYVELG